MEQFDHKLSSVIDSTLGLRCKLYGYQYSEIIRSLMSVCFRGGSCIEDVTSHLMRHLSPHPTFRTCSADTILRAIKELSRENVSYISDTGKGHDLNTADTLNSLLLNCLFAAGQLKGGEMYDVDFDHQFMETEKYGAKPTYKKFLGYRPVVAVIGDLIVGIVYNDIFALRKCVSPQVALWGKGVLCAEEGFLYQLPAISVIRGRVSRK